MKKKKIHKLSLRSPKFPIVCGNIKQIFTKVPKSEFPTQKGKSLSRNFCETQKRVEISSR